MSSHRIIERKFPVNHHLVQKIFGTVSSIGSEDAYAQIVYFNESNPQIITAQLVYIQDWENEPEGLTNLWEEDLTFNECLMISTF